MNDTIRRRPSRPGLVLAAMAVIAGIGQLPARAAETAAPDTPTAQDPEARARLNEMASFMARAPGFRVTIRSDYDAIQEDGQRIEFGERRKFLLQRPDKLRVEAERSDGDKGVFVFDGRRITAYNADQNVYAQVDKPGNVDQALVYMVRDLRTTMPLARMLTTGFPVDMEKRVASAVLVEECTLFDVPTEHIAVRSPEVDMQLWIATGAEPLPRRIVITYKNAPGQPQFRADFHDWSLAPKVDAASFAFVPPAGAERIAFLARRPPPGVTAPPTGDKP